MHVVNQSSCTVHGSKERPATLAFQQHLSVTDTIEQAQKHVNQHVCITYMTALCD